MDRTRTALREMAREDPELAARLIIQTLPAAASRIRAPLRYQLTVGDMGTWLVVVDDDGARVQPGMDGDVELLVAELVEVDLQRAFQALRRCEVRDLPRVADADLLVRFAFRC